ncbi:MAG: ABC transporter substrate-binding protein [Bordetella sp.]|nr:ABC transporter substrate-binding protein [Bordetella sp.]
MNTLLRAAIVAAAGFITGTGAHAQGEPIRIGAVLSSTGPVGFIGDPQQKTLEIQVKRLNDQGGILGRKISLTVYDDQSDPNNANTFAKRLVDTDKVDVLLGGTVTPNAMAMVPSAERAGVPFVSIGGGLALVEPVKKWVFKTPHSDRMVAERILQDMKERGLKRIALLYETSGFGQSGRKEVLAAAERFGVTVVGEESYGPKDTDITPQFTRLRNLQNVESMLIFSGAGTSPAVAIKNYAQMGFKLPVYMPHAAVNQEFLRLGGPATEGVRMPTAGFVVPDALRDGDPQKPVSADFYRTYKEAYKADASPFGGNIADALAIAVDGIKRAGGTDKAKVRDAIESTKGLVGLNGIFTMTPTNHNGLAMESLRIIEVRNGRFELVK